jgi:hypothetical protein
MRDPLLSPGFLDALPPPFIPPTASTSLPPPPLPPPTPLPAPPQHSYYHYPTYTPSPLSLSFASTGDIYPNQRPRRTLGVCLPWRPFWRSGGEGKGKGRGSGNANVNEGASEGAGGRERNSGIWKIGCKDRVELLCVSFLSFFIFIIWLFISLSNSFTH